MSTAVELPVFSFPFGDNLNARQNLFIIKYLETKNATKAAQLAGYDGDYDSLSVTASRLLSSAKIRNAIESYFKSRHLSPDGVLAELSDIASSPWKDHVEVKYGENGEVIQANLRLSDKIKALELTGKAQGMFADRSESVNINIDLSGNDLASILQGALSAGAIDVSDTAIDVTPEPASCPIDETDQA